jgi:MoaA/NifB/PqqE/SkfB family radical SAM enzyme
MTAGTSIRRTYLAAHRRARELFMIGRALASTRHVVQAHIIPIRRCNLACTYCNEFDDFSKPVPLADLQARVDHLARLGTSFIVISGGEPLLHPELDGLIRHIREKCLIAALITNGYLLTRDRIEKLNAAGLDHLQISIDNVQPDDVSKKSLKVLDQKLALLAEHADFHVNINSVLGSGVTQPADAQSIADRAITLGFSTTVGIIHDHNGQLRPLGDVERQVFEYIMALDRRSYSRFNRFQRNIAAGKPNEWRCRAGARYLYICEDGLVHYCSQKRGIPGVPIAQYTQADLDREFVSKKACAPRCTISCVQQTSFIDFWRTPQHLKAKMVPATAIKAASPLVGLSQPAAELTPATKNDTPWAPAGRGSGFSR